MIRCLVSSLLKTKLCPRLLWSQVKLSFPCEYTCLANEDGVLKLLVHLSHCTILCSSMWCALRAAWLLSSKPHMAHLKVQFDLGFPLPWNATFRVPLDCFSRVFTITIYNYNLPFVAFLITFDVLRAFSASLFEGETSRWWSVLLTVISWLMPWSSVKSGSVSAGNVGSSTTDCSGVVFDFRLVLHDVADLCILPWVCKAILVNDGPVLVLELVLCALRGDGQVSESDSNVCSTYFVFLLS